MQPESELVALRAMAAELADYLRSDVLFWQMQAGSDFPKLSLGQLLLTRARARGARAQLIPARQAQADEAEAAVEAALQKWPVAAEKKAERELRQRVNLWRRYIEDCRDRPQEWENYSGEVRQRAIAGLLLRTFVRLADSPEAHRLSATDEQLRGQFETGAFVWQADLRSEFPQPDFWYLYGRARGER